MKISLAEPSKATRALALRSRVTCNAVGTDGDGDGGDDDDDVDDADDNGDTAQQTGREQRLENL
eukprot:3978509-Pleurochrysis_carterae.AAC.1